MFMLSVFVIYVIFCFFLCSFFFFFFNDTATTEIYTLSLHDALPISNARFAHSSASSPVGLRPPWRSEEHTSEHQSHSDLVCRLLLEKKKKKKKKTTKKKKKKKKKKNKKTQ